MVTVLILLFFAALFLALAGLLAVGVLTIGKLLTLIFAVSEGDASFVVAVLAAALLIGWAIMNWTPTADLLPIPGDQDADEAEVEGEPRIYLTTLPPPSARRGKKRRR